VIRITGYGLRTTDYGLAYGRLPILPISARRYAVIVPAILARPGDFSIGEWGVGMGEWGGMRCWHAGFSGRDALMRVRRIAGASG